MYTNKISFLNSKSQPSAPNIERKKLCMFGKNMWVLNSTSEKFSPQSPLLIAEPHRSGNSLGNSQVKLWNWKNWERKYFKHWVYWLYSTETAENPTVRNISGEFPLCLWSTTSIQFQLCLTEIIQGVLNIRQQHEGFIRTKKQLEVSRIKFTWHFGAQWTWKILNYHIIKQLTVSKMAIILSWLLCAVKQQRPAICNLVTGPCTT